MHASESAGTVRGMQLFMGRAGSSLLATASMCFMPRSWVAFADGLSCNHTLQYSHQNIGLLFHLCGHQYNVRGRTEAS
jgi:hypothetical protein